MKRIAVFGIAVAATVRVALALETPYVTDGLVAMWDAIENVGPGQPHDNAATTWVNLVDPDKYTMTWNATYGKVNWSDDAANFSRTQGADGCGFFAGAFAYAAEMGTNWTIEATVMADEWYFNNYSGICGNGNGGTLGKRLPYFGQYENGSLVTRVHDVPSGGISGVSVPSANLKLNALQTLSFSDSPTTFGFYIDGAAVASGSNGNTANSTLSDSADFRIGNCTEALERMFSGKIHCVRVYNRVLTDAERLRNKAVDFERYVAGRSVDVRSASDVLPDDFFSPGRGMHLGYAPGDSVACTASAEPFEVEDWGVVSNATVTGWTIYTNSPSASAWAEWRKGDGTSCTFDHPGVAVRVVWNVGFELVSRDPDPIRGYVHEGLVAMWDAHRNAGFGRPHDNSATIWRNLVDTNKYALTWNATNGKVNWSDDAANFSRTQGADGCGFFAGAFAYAAEMGANWTIEATVVADEGYFNNYSGICGNGNGGTLGKRLPYFGQYENGSLVTRVHDVQSGGTSGVSVPSANLKLNALQTLSFSDSPTTFGFYIDGAAVASGSNGNTANSTVSDSADFRIGNCTEALERMFSGKIHCVRIYNRVLTDAERRQNCEIDRFRIEEGKPDVLVVSGDPPDVVSDSVSPGYGLHDGYSAGQAVRCEAPLDAVRIVNKSVVTNAQVVGYAIYTNIAGTISYVLMKKGKGSLCTFEHPGVSTRVVWSWEVSVAPNVDVSVSTYVNDGLVAMWDGEHNAGRNLHDSAASRWVNLVDESKYALEWDDSLGGARWWDATAAHFTHGNRADTGLQGHGFWKTAGFPYSAAMGANWTIEASVRPEADYFSNYSGICGNGNSGDIHLPTFGQNENGYACFRVYRVQQEPGVITLGPEQLPVGRIQTITYSDSPATASVWVDAVSAGSIENGSSLNSTLGASGDFRIGSAHIADERVFDGSIHCVRLYNRVLTADEIARNAIVDRARFGGACVRIVDGNLQCLTRVQTFGPVTASVNGGASVASFAEWNPVASRTVTVGATTAAPRCVWRTTAGMPEGNALAVTTAYPVDVLLDAYDPSAANQRVVDVAAAAGAVNAVSIGSLAGIQRIHVGAVNGGAGAAELTLGGKLRITVSGNGYAIIEPDGRSIGRAKIMLFNGAQLMALDDAEAGDLVLYGNSSIELNGHALRYHSTVHRNRTGWDPYTRVLDSVGGGTFGYERVSGAGLVLLLK